MENADAPKEQSPIRSLHGRPKKYLAEWLDFPAHVHQTAYRMDDPPNDRPRSRNDFVRILKSLNIPQDNQVVSEKFGYGVRIEKNGDRLILVWEAHTEYYNYQIWHIPDDKTLPLEFGPITIPDFKLPLSPFGTAITCLDIVISQETKISAEMIREMLPGPHIYGSKVFGDDIVVVTSFTPDDNLAERYLIFSQNPNSLLEHLDQVTGSVVTIENYYHLLLLPFSEFTKAVDRIHQLEQHHLQQRTAITAHLGSSDSKKLQDWVTFLTQDFLEIGRFAEAMRYQLSASAPYNAIIHSTVRALQEQPFAQFFPLSDYVLGGISGVADGYQQLIKRIEAVESDFQGIISVIRTRVNLMQQDQNLVLGDQNLKILSSVDQTTKSQVLLQHTVEGLSIIVIAYYLSGLADYIFKAMQELGWIEKASLATGIFVPISLGFAFLLTFIGRKFIHKLLGSDKVK